ncbi:MAG: hypothetical protein AB7P33_09550 [Dehalococcoidia bacterium]
MSESTFLSHVLWLGGPPDAGKTTIAKELAEWHGLQLYRFDEHEQDHMARAEPAAKPALWAAKPENLTPEQRWLTFTPDEMAYATIDSWSERFEYACEDLLAMPKSPAIIAEGPGFFPDLVMMVLDDPRQAAFLIPTPAFQLESVERRQKPGDRHETTNPQQATANLIARDQYMTEHIRTRAEALGLTIIEIDGTRPVDDIAGQLELQWAPWLHL